MRAAIEGAVKRWFTGSGWAFLLCLLGLTAAAAALVYRGQAPVLGDYAEWTYHGVLLRNVLQGHPDAAYVLKRYPVPNSLTTVALGLLMLLLPWKIAAKVLLIAELAVGMAAAVQLQKGAGRAQGWRLLVLPAAMFLGIAFWDGFTNFLFGVSLAMLLCAVLLRGFESRWVYGLLLAATFFSHMIPFSFALLVLVLYAMEKGRWQLLWQAVPSAVLTGWYLVGRMMHGNADAHAGMVASVPYMTPLFVAFKANTYLKCWGFVNPASTGQDSILLRLVGAKIFVVLLVLNAVLAAGVLLLLGSTAWRALRTKAGPRCFWIAFTVFFLASLGMPGAAAGISDPGGRMMQVAVWCGVCLVATKRDWTGALLGCCALVLLGVDLYLLGAVGMRPPVGGATAGPLPARAREFAHVYYADRWSFYAAIEAGKMDEDIYPTAMFLKRDPRR